MRVEERCEGRTSGAGQSKGTARVWMSSYRRHTTMMPSTKAVVKTMRTLLSSSLSIARTRLVQLLFDRREARGKVVNSVAMFECPTSRLRRCKSVFRVHFGSNRVSLITNQTLNDVSTHRVSR